MRDRIIDTATSLFVERGFAGVAMREISEACGITKAALYYHFTSKAQLLYAICTDYLEINAAVVDKVLAEGGTHEEQLRRLVQDLFAVPGEQRAILRLALHDLDSLDAHEHDLFLDAYRKRFTEPVIRLFTEGEADGEFRRFDPELLVWFMLGMAYPYFGLPDSPGTPNDPAMVDQILDIFVGGLKTRSLA